MVPFPELPGNLVLSLGQASPDLPNVEGYRSPVWDGVKVTDGYGSPFWGGMKVVGAIGPLFGVG